MVETPEQINTLEPASAVRIGLIVKVVLAVVVPHSLVTATEIVCEPTFEKEILPGF